ncbi:GIY-YIG nuclease family protein [Dyella sp.]|uniref:GIY-YIG nuclease family protein n=1 Tax=Dyella sp. TaxID=1869338 RepID=UPI002B4A7438|nr:GIY-YIG nuclease family protein [Dyella sp.]HKT26566.1 GIY-YIG nuclease family protein [Dyella sp.]
MQCDILYLLVNEEHSAFKIGVSHRPHQRISRLPNNIDVSSSYEVRFRDGSAYEAERVLHHMFRQKNFDMPRGEGYTEWFDIASLEDVLRFIENQKHLLSVEEICRLRPRPLPLRATTEERIAKRAAKEKRAAERSHIAAEQHERARRVNEESLIQLEAWLDEVENIGSLTGILKPRPAKPNDDGYIYLKGSQASRLFEKAQDPIEKWTSLVCPHGFMAILCGGSQMSRNYMQICVNGRFLTDEPIDPYHQSRFPGCEAVRSMLVKRAAVIGTPDDLRLQRIRRTIRAQEAKFFLELEKQWSGALSEELDSR